MSAIIPQQLVIVGLGNPGTKYARTRHNLGFLVVEEFAQAQHWHWKEEKRFHARVAKGMIGRREVHLLMPTTYMNESGRAVKSYLDFYKMAPENVLIVTDDVAIPYGTMRLRKKGSSGGHNGLNSVEAYLGTNHYARLKMGIGAPREHMDLVAFVLGEYSSEEALLLPPFVKKGAEALSLFACDTITHVMNTIN